MHSLFGITFVLFLLKLSAGKGFCFIPNSHFEIPHMPIHHNVSLQQRDVQGVSKKRLPFQIMSVSPASSI